MYDSLIERAKPRGLDKSKVEGYYEKHHILPRCLGGSDREANLILLTGREHFIAHMLLWKAFPDNISLMRAAFMMSSRSKDSNSHTKVDGKISSKTYAVLREQYANAVSIQCTGEGNPFFGKKHPPETLARIRTTLEAMGKWKPVQEKIKKVRPPKKVKPPKPTFYERMALTVDNRSSLWACADIVENFWERSGKVGGKFLDNLLVYKLGNRFPSTKGLLEKLDTNWIPENDTEWCKLRNDPKFKDIRNEVSSILSTTVSSDRRTFKGCWLSNRESLRSLITEQLQLLEIPLRTIYSSGTTVTDRIEMRILDESNSISHLDIATEFGLKRNTVSSVCSNKPQEKFKYLESKDALELMRDTLTNQFPKLFISKPLLDIRTLRCIT